jgi:hypothetical protein
MRLRSKILLTAVAVAAASATLLVPIAGAAARGATGGWDGMRGGGTTSGGWCGGGIWNGSGSWGGTGMWGMGTGMAWLTDNPAAMQAWLRLRADHLAAMQTWYDTYQADPTSPEAQKALHDLWTGFWNDMKSFYEKYGNGATWTSPGAGMWNGWQMGGMMGGGSWNANHMWGSGYGASWMTSHAAGMGQWLAMRSGQMSAMNAWWQQHHSAPASASARGELRTLMARQRTQVRRFFQQHHLSTSSALMNAGAGGWVGLGGMWGGFGW